MKKTVALLLVMVLCVFFISCASDRNSNNNHGGNNVAYFPGDSSNTTVCTACSGTKVCTICYGDSDCLECDGSGISRCWDCLGDGECLNCSGDGGSYEYNFYSGTEWEKCSYCYGSGNCRSCGGDAEVTCNRCYGADGYCSFCSNSGVCSTCRGTGTITGNTTSQNQSQSNQQVQNSENNENNTTNILVATIDGTEYKFQLDFAKVKTDYREDFTYIQAHYLAVNPRGEILYDLYLSFDANFGCGTYDIMDDSYALDLGWMLTPSNSKVSYCSNRTNGTSVIGSFTITERSDDWQTYSGYSNATLRTQENNPVSVDFRVSYFNFTLS